jgi:hypothetical protein
MRMIDLCFNVLHTITGSSLTAEWRRGRPHGLTLRALPTGVNYVSVYVFPPEELDATLSTSAAAAAAVPTTGIEELDAESVEHADSDPKTYTGSVIRDDGGRYDGDLRMGRFHGHGSFLWPNGELYVGQWKSGSRHGVGTHVWPNDKYYVGG